MEYFKLIAGLILTVTFIWLFVKSRHRTNFINALLSVDIILGLVAAVYLVFTSTYTLLIH